MKNCPSLNEIIQVHDYPVLKHLKDIQIKTPVPNQINDAHLDNENLGFNIEFVFGHENPFFENKVSVIEFDFKLKF